VDLYDSDAESRLLVRLVPQLDHRSMIGVGAQQGGQARELLQAGIENLHLIDSQADFAQAEGARVEADERVTVHESGARITERSLQSRLEAGEIPQQVGILAIGGEHDNLAIISGMGSLEAEIVVVQHWKDMPGGLGPCPWTAEEILAQLRPRGLGHFASIVRDGEFTTLKWGDAHVERGAIGSLVFLHESRLERMLPAVLQCSGSVAQGAVRVGQAYMRAWNDREALVKELRRAADERLALINQLEQACEERLALINELTETCEDRLATINELTEVSETRLRALESVNEQLEAQRS
jgi:hypothetical protein